MSRPNETPMDRDLRRLISYKIKRLAYEKGMSQAYIASKTKIPKTTINGYFNGTSLPTPGNTEKIAKLFNVSKADIDPRFKSNLTETLVNQPGNLIELSPPTVKVPILGEIACGEPMIVAENFSGYRFESPENLPSGKLIYLEAKGDSMEPTIPNGSYVLIREQPEVENGEIAAVVVNGESEATLKRIKRQGDTIMLVPDNPKYDPYIITKDNPARIIGKAVRFTRDL